MFKSIKSYLLLTITIISLLGLSCKLQLGMGDSLDLEAPVLTITSPKKNALLHSTVELNGTCTDNRGVTAVVVSNNLTGEEYGKAKIDGNTWTLNVKLPEGEITLRCTASDAAGNTSTKSTKTISLLIDDTAPEGLAWFVERGNAIPTPFYELNELKNINTNLSVNKDIPQNERFYIHGRFYDAMSLDSVTVTLKDGNDVVSQKTVTATDITGTSSIYTPVFEFTDEEITANSKYKTGKHYFQVCYTTKDEHGNTRTEDLDYILWYPESDRPCIEQTQTTEDGEGNLSLTVSIGSAIPFTFFDDDGLLRTYFKFSDTEITADSFTYDPADTEHYSGKTGIRDNPRQISSSETQSSGVYYLALFAQEDKKDENGNQIDDEKTKVIKIITVNVVDAAFPLLIIEKPIENSIPEIDAGTISEFTIKGVANDTTGSAYVTIAYIPDSDEFNTSAKKEERAKTLFEGAEKNDGEIVKKYEFPSTKNKDGKFVKESFWFTFDLLNDFGSAGKDRKFFEIMVQDTEGNRTYKQFNINGDSVLPEIELDTTAGTEAVSDGAVCDYLHKNLVIKYKASKSNGLGIDESKYKIVRKNSDDAAYTLADGPLDNNGNTIKLTKDGEYIKLTIDKDQAKTWAEGEKPDTQPVFTLYAADVLGNETTKQLSVVLSPLPVLDSISSDKSDGTYKFGDEITIQAKFTDSVKIEGEPRLKLYYTSNVSGTPDAYAEYKTGSNSNTLTFSFKVPAVSEDKLYCGGIDLNGGKIETAGVGQGDATIDLPAGKNLQDTNNISLDGISPKVKANGIKLSVNVTKNADDNKYYVPADKEIEVEIECTENVFVSGNPVLNLKAGVNVLPFTFKTMKDNKLYFSHKVSNLSANGTVSYEESKFFNSSDLQTIADQTGNILVLGSQSDNSSIVIDTDAPATPVITSLEDGQSYNEVKTITATGLETGATWYYSKDGGVSWTSFTTAPTLGSGTHKVSVRQQDKAGNYSAASTVLTVTINTNFPKLSSISIAKADGNYPSGTNIDFKVFFEGKINVPANTSATLKFVPHGKTEANAGTALRELKVTALASAANSIVFPYTVKDGDDFNGVKITSITFDTTTAKKVTDEYGNVPDSTTTTQITALLNTDDCDRENLILDGTLPTATYSPINGGVNSSDNDEFKVVLTFNENVFAESGTITLRPYESASETWAIPPVLSAEDFNEIYNNPALTAADKTTLIQMDGSLPKTDSITGMPVGPYKKMSHGLKVSGGKFVPDITSKYVLDYQYGLYETTGVVKNIRDVLKKANYLVQEVDINDAEIEDNVVTITFPKTVKDGRKWELLITEGALRDDTGNLYEGIAAGEYVLWSDYTANPVVRVDRYSHGMGAMGLKGTKEVEIDGYARPYTSQAMPASVDKTGTNGNGKTLAPIGYCKVRIDCETPGAEIYYSQVAGGSKKLSDVKSNSQESRGTIADIGTASLKLTTGGTKYTTVISVGDKTYTTSSKDYITAYATKTNLKKSKNTDASYTGPDGKEGVFKTTVIGTEKGKTAVNIEGGTSKGGVPIVDAFPLRDATNDFRYSKNAYSFTEDSKNHYAWVTYDIVSDFVVLQVITNYAQDYPAHSYGNLLYLNEYPTWE